MKEQCAKFGPDIVKFAEPITLGWKERSFKGPDQFLPNGVKEFIKKIIGWGENSQEKYGSIRGFGRNVL